MQYFEETAQLDEAIDQLITVIQQSDCMQRYRQAKQAMAASEEVKCKKKKFLEAKAAFERISSYGPYAPDYQERKKAAYRAKRQLDLTSEVAHFRQCETELQAMLDEVAVQLAGTVSDKVKVEKGNPFFTTNKRCGGHCHE